MKKNKKLLNILLVFFIFFIMVFSIQIASPNTHYTFEYDETTKVVTIIDPDLNITVVQIRLVTDLIHNVFYGKDRKIAEMEFFNYIDDFEDTIKDLDDLSDISFDDFEEGIVEKTFVYKFKNKTGEVNITEYEFVCNPFDEFNEENQTIQTNPNCTQIESGFHTIEKFEWVNLSFLPTQDIIDENINVGIFLEVFPGETVDWLPVFFNVYLGDVWAVWSEAHNNELQLYYYLNSSSLNETDWVNGHLNISHILIEQRDFPGIINGSFKYDSTTGEIASTLDNFNTSNLNFTNYGSSSNGTISLWINWTGAETSAGSGGHDAVFEIGGSNGNRLAFQVNNRTNGNNNIDISFQFETESAWNMFGPTNGLNDIIYNWTHIVILHNGSGPELYVNAVKQVITFDINTEDAILNRSIWIQNLTDIDTTLGVRASTIFFGAINSLDLSYNGSIDEFAIWNRTLTDGDCNVGAECGGEIGDLYNSGVGITYDSNPELLVTINFPQSILGIRNYSFNDLPLNFNVTLGIEGSVAYSFDVGMIDNITMVSSGDQISFTGTVFNNTNDSISDGIYRFSVFANASGGLINNSVNASFNLDQTFPNVTIGDITTSSGSNTVTFNATTEDTHVTTCFFTVYDANGNVNNGISNDSYTCNTNENFEVSIFATYTIFVHSNDTHGNVNSSESKEFTTIEFSGGGSSSGGGGSGGGTVIIVEGENVTWSMSTVPGPGNKYELDMVPGSQRTKAIRFNNIGGESVTLTLSCEGELCDFVEFEDAEIVLPIGLDIPTQTEFKIIVPADVEEKSYVANIIATDDTAELNKGILTVQVDIGLAGFFGEILTKIVSTKILFGLPIPYLLLVFLIISVVFVIFNFIVFRPLRTFGLGLSLGLAVLIGLGSLIFI